MSINIVLGAQWGDEGKGKLVDILAQSSDICARAAGGNNAGHTIYVTGDDGLKKKFAFHLVPSGLINPKCVGLLGAGVVIHLPSFFQEIESLHVQGLDVASRLLVSDRATLVFDFDQICDGIGEGELTASGTSIGTTRKGIGPSYSAKAARSALKVCHLFAPDLFKSRFTKLAEERQKRYGPFLYDVEAEISRYLGPGGLAERVKPYVVDGLAYLHKSLGSSTERKENLLIEGANAVLLDLDWGTYPFVTSSSTGIGGVFTGLGLNPKALYSSQRTCKIIGVVKAYTTRVGAGPFPTELDDDVAKHLQISGHEFGTTTGRPRRCGWLDLVVLRHSCLVNGYDVINFTKLDVLSGLSDLLVCTAYLDPKTQEEITTLPADLEYLDTLRPVYKKFEGWMDDLTAVKKWENLPVKAQEYIGFVEAELGVKAEWIGVGGGRDEMIWRKQ